VSPGCPHSHDVPRTVTGNEKGWLSRTIVYYRAMSYRNLRESPTPSTDEDVEPYFPEPEVELDLDTLD
jgi:hypothetical protein